MSGYIRSVSVGAKTGMAFLAISLLMVVQAFIAMRNMAEMTSSFHAISESGIPSVKNAGLLTQTIAELQLREYQLSKASPAELQGAQRQVQRSQEQVSRSIEQALALADSDEERRLARLAEQQWQSYQTLRNRPHGVDAIDGESAHRFDDLLATVQSIVRVNADEALDATRHGDESYRRSFESTMAFIGIAVLATLAFGWGLSRALSRRLAHLLRIGRRITDSGHSILAQGGVPQTDEIDQLTAVLGQVYETRNRSLSVSRLTHELRTPLNSILGFAELMLSQRDAALPEVHADYVRQVVQSGQHLIRLIDGLLDLSRMEAGLAHLRLALVDLAVLIDEALKVIAPLAQGRELSVRFRPLDESARWVKADKMRLLQVVLNLLSNAVKYNREGGVIEVETRENLTTGQVGLVVRDSGQGIPPQHRQELFKPFQRLGRESSTVQGTGLGLAISSKLVHLMHGDIQVDSTWGVGSQFTVWLPCAQRGPSLAPEASVAPDTPPKTTPAGVESPRSSPPRPLAGTVLHVDDDETSRILMQAYFLSHPQVRLLSADGAASGIQIVRRERPDVVLVDICMPEVDGYEFLRRVRAGLHMDDVRCVAVSANASNEDAQAAIAAGFDGYLVKPLSMSALFNCVDPWLQTA